MSLEPLYRQIPTLRCKPGCGTCCGVVPWAPEEWAKVALRAPAGVTLMDLDGCVIPVREGSATCPFFNHGCTVYEDRPFMCRLFGTAPEAALLACPHGCAPAHPLTSRKAAKLTSRYSRETATR